MDVQTSTEIRPAASDGLPALLRLLPAKAVFDRCPEALQASSDSWHAAMFGDA
jgi:hypothetical protein